MDKHILKGKNDSIIHWMDIIKWLERMHKIQVSESKWHNLINIAYNKNDSCANNKEAEKGIRLEKHF